MIAVAESAPDDLLGDPSRLLQYLLDHMLAGHEQDDDVTVLVMHVPSGQSNDTATGSAATQQWVHR